MRTDVADGVVCPARVGDSLSPGLQDMLRTEPSWAVSALSSQDIQQ